MPSSHGPDSSPDSNHHNDRSSNNAFELASLFEGSPGANQASQLQRSLRHLANREGRSKPIARFELDDIAPLESIFRASVTEDINNGDVFGDSTVDQVIVLNHAAIQTSRSRPGPIYSLVAELRDNDGRSFAITSSGIHLVKGLASHRITSFPKDEENYQYEVLMTKDCVEKERVAFEKSLEAGEHISGQTDRLFLAGLICDEVLYTTDREDFSFTDVLAVEFEGGNLKSGVNYELYLTDGTVLGVRLSYSRKNSMVLADVALAD
jgi:hypothetical protein